MAGVYDGWGNERGRFIKLANGDWRNVPFSNQKLTSRKNSRWSDVTLPSSEIGGNYTSPWTFLWLEDDSDFRWIQDARIVRHRPPFGSGSDKAKVKKFFQEEIFPVIKSAFLTFRQEQFNESRINGLLFQAWMDSLEFESFYEKVVPNQTDSYPDINIYIYLYSIQKDENDINKYANEVGKLANQLGFIDYVKEKSGTDEEVSANEISDRRVEDLSNEEKKAVAAALAAANLGIDANQKVLSNREMLDISQCALMSDLFNKGYSYKQYPASYTRGKDDYNKCFNGRIYPVTVVDVFDPNELINYCTVPRNIQNFFNDDQIVSNNLWWALSWVYQDAEGLKETNIFLNSSDPHNDYSGVKRLVSDNLLTENQLASWDIQKRLNGYVFTDIKIEYDGTNPATARNSVKVTMNIDLDHLSSLDTVCGYSKVVSSPTRKDDSGFTMELKRGGTVQLRIHDLVTVTQIPSVNITTPGGKGYYLNTYTPDSSRLRLKVWFDETGFKTSSSGTEAGMIIDLTMIEHELARTDDAENKTRLTITYRGYFEEAMNAPYNDALATHGMIKKRAAREKKVKEAIRVGCSSQSMREIERALEEANRSETRKFHDDGGIPGRLMMEGHLYSYSINTDLYAIGRIGSRLDPKYNYVNVDSIEKVSSQNVMTSIAAQTTGSMLNTQEALEQYAANAGKEVTTGGYLGGLFGGTTTSIIRNNNYFFYLGDLLEMVTDSIYEPNTAEHNEHTKGLNMRFIIGTFKIPDPQNISKTITINPVQIPIDYGFFIDWYNDTIVKKGISNYAIGPFIKDLLEKLVNGILYDNCFSLLHLDENPPQFRTSFFTDHGKSWFKSTETTYYSDNGNTTGHDFDPNNPYGDGEEPNLLIKKDVFAPVGQSKNYCVVYQQFPSYFRQIRSNGSNLSSKPTTVTLMDGFNNKGKNFCSGISFSKANSNSYQKEALYFGSNNAGSLVLMNNVYDLSFKIQTKKMNTVLYPGNIINFIVTDFAGNQWAGGNLGESDPHTRGTKANILGYGGYYIVTKVEYNLSIVQSVASATIQVTSKFLGTDAHYSVTKEENKTDSFASDPKECADIYNAQVDEIREYDLESAGGFRRATSSGQSASVREIPTIEEISPEEAEQIAAEREPEFAAGEAAREAEDSGANSNTIPGIIQGTSFLGAVPFTINYTAPQLLNYIVSMYYASGSGFKGQLLTRLEIDITSLDGQTTKKATIRLITLAYDAARDESDPLKSSYSLEYDGGYCVCLNGNFTEPEQ